MVWRWMNKWTQLGTKPVQNNIDDCYSEWQIYGMTGYG